MCDLVNLLIESVLDTHDSLWIVSASQLVGI